MTAPGPSISSATKPTRRPCSQFAGDEAAHRDAGVRQSRHRNMSKGAANSGLSGKSHAHWQRRQISGWRIKGRQSEAIARDTVLSMRTRRHRRIDALLLALAGLVIGAVALVGAVAGNPEHVAGIWSGAIVQPDGSAHISEAIDYDFGYGRHHGIFRDVPRLQPDAAVKVSSATAPDDVQLSTTPTGARIRIGDPSRTVGGRHRYLIEYPLGGVAPGGRLAWNAVGTGWSVKLSNIEIHLVAPFQLEAVRCVRGAAGATTPCKVAQPEPGHLVVEIGSLDLHQGATLYASAGRELEAAPPLPSPPPASPAATGTSPFVPGVLAAVLALASAAAVSRLVRRAGRERVAVGDAGRAGIGSEVRLDAEQLASLATIEYVPPEGLTPAQGGVLLAGGVQRRHKVAWLIDAAVDGHIRLEGEGGDVTLVRCPHHDGGSIAATLDIAFAGRERLQLGTYDTSFAAAWRRVGKELRVWQQESGRWDPTGELRRVRGWLIGFVGAAFGLGCAFVGGGDASRTGAAGLALVVPGALLAGCGVSAALRAWELRTLTVAGSGSWLRVESFRRFLAESDAHCADEAATQDHLLQYTAWAVAVGEIDRWSSATAASAVAQADPAYYSATMVPYLSRATAASSVSSSGGNGGGGGVDGGAGGGGGSW